MGNNIGSLYTKDRKLGKGKFASVFKCIRKSDGEAFAVKTFKKNNITHDEFKKIKLEKKILQNVDHPTILKFVDFVEDE